MIEELKIATFMAEADEKISSAIKIIKDTNIDNIVFTNTGEYTLQEYITLMKASEIGVVGMDIKSEQSAFNYEYYKDLALALNPKFAIYNWDGTDIDQVFLDRFIDCSIQGNFTPMLCMNNIKNTLKPRDKQLDKILNISRRLHLCLDPVEIVLRYNIDIYDEYFKKYYNKIGALVVRDYKIGVGNRPVGYGSIRWREIFGHLDKYNGWLIFKPSLGTRYNNLVNRGDIFKASYSAFVELVETCQ